MFICAACLFFDFAQCYYYITRKEAICKIISALAEFIVSGIHTNIDFQLKILRNRDFRNGNVDIGFYCGFNIVFIVNFIMYAN